MIKLYILTILISVSVLANNSQLEIISRNENNLIHEDSNSFNLLLDSMELSINNELKQTINNIEKDKNKIKELENLIKELENENKQIDTVYLRIKSFKDFKNYYKQ